MTDNVKKIVDVLISHIPTLKVLMNSNSFSIHIKGQVVASSTGGNVGKIKAESVETDLILILSGMLIGINSK